MNEETKIRPSEELAYWIGVVQSDGYFRKRGIASYLIEVSASTKSLPMLHKFQEVSKSIFSKTTKMWKTKNRDEWKCAVTMTKFIEAFENLSIKFTGFIPPEWCLENSSLFGAYLSGLIDGDGDIRIKRKKYPQCVIRIGSGDRQDELASSINKFLSCSVSQTQRYREVYFKSRNQLIKGSWFELEFLISRKNFDFILTHIIPYLTSVHKKERILSFLKEKYAMAGI